MDLIQCCALKFSHLPRRSSWILSHVHQTTVALPLLMWAGTTILASSSPTPLFPPYFVAPQTPPVPSISRLQWKSCYRSVGTPAHACVSCLLGPSQRVVHLQRTCHISDQSGKCDADTSPLRGRVGSLPPGSLLRACKSLSWSAGALELMQGRGPSGPAARPLITFKGNPAPSTGVLVSSSPASGRSRVLWKMEGLGAAIILFASQGLVLPGCFLERGLGERMLVSRDCSLYRLGRNLLGGLLHSLCPGNSEGWVVARSESRFRWWHLPPG